MKSILAFLFLPLGLLGQSDTTSASKAPKQSRIYLTPRIGGGIQHAGFAEFGLSRLSMEDKGLSFSSYC